MLYFFLSYAHGVDDPFVEQFYRDLSAEVRIHAGLRRDAEVGFLDAHSIQAGQRWPGELVDALSQCHTFVALASPRYFASPVCGREWTLFAERMRRYEKDAGRAATPALMPLLWLPATPELPPAVQRLQVTTDQLNDVYSRLGLRQLARLQRHRDDYLELLSALGRHIVAFAERHPLPPLPSRVDLEAVPSAFHGPPPDPTTTQYVHFVVVAGSRTDLRGVRQSLDYYGDDPLDWAPYQPSRTEPLATFAQRVAASRGFRSRACRVEELPDVLDIAARSNQLVVLLIDAWATQSPPLRRLLDAHADRPSPWRDAVVAALVPANHDDAETRARWPLLSGETRTALAALADTANDLLYRSMVSTPAAFDEDLQAVLEVARNRSFVTGAVHRRPPADPAQRPILDAP